MAKEIVGPPSKKCTKCGEAKCISKFGKKKGGRHGVRSICKECQKSDDKRYPNRTNPARRRLPSPEFKEKERLRNKERKSQRGEYYQRTRDIRIAKQLEYAKQNPAVFAARAMRRIAQKRRATPPWACEQKIVDAYRLAASKSIETGSKWHVDHIVPLISEIVCGLHVEANLEVVTAAENIAKGNRYWPDMP